MTTISGTALALWNFTYFGVNKFSYFCCNTSTLDDGQIKHLHVFGAVKIKMESKFKAFTFPSWDSMIYNSAPAGSGTPRAGAPL